jgi:transcription antitermination factor NusG
LIKNNRKIKTNEIMSKYWYVLHCKPHKETSVVGQLGFHQIEYYYPTLKVRPVNPRSQKIKPFFPGYLFVQLDLALPSSAILKWMAGTVGLVSFDYQPAAVPDNLVLDIRQRVQKLLTSGRANTHFQRGEDVCVMEGPLAGMRGIFDLNLPGSQRVRVLLRILGEHFIRMEMPAGIIESIKQP